MRSTLEAIANEVPPKAFLEGHVVERGERGLWLVDDEVVGGLEAACHAVAHPFLLIRSRPWPRANATLISFATPTHVVVTLAGESGVKTRIVKRQAPGSKGEEARMYDVSTADGRPIALLADQAEVDRLLSVHEGLVVEAIDIPVFAARANGAPPLGFAFLIPPSLTLLSLVREAAERRQRISPSTMYRICVAPDVLPAGLCGRPFLASGFSYVFEEWPQAKNQVILFPT